MEKIFEMENLFNQKGEKKLEKSFREIHYL